MIALEHPFNDFKFKQTTDTMSVLTDTPSGGVQSRTNGAAAAPTNTVPANLRDPDAGLTPQEAEGWKLLLEAKRSGKLYPAGTSKLVMEPGGKDYFDEYWTLSRKSFLGRGNANRAIMETLRAKLDDISHDVEECAEMELAIIEASGGRQ